MTQTNCIVVIYDNTGKIWYQGSGLGTIFYRCCRR